MTRTRRSISLRSAATALAIVVGVPPTVSGQALPADAAGAVARLEASPRHGEWVKYDAGGGDSVAAWVVYPERSDRAPVVIVIHEIFGLTDWIRAVADQLAAEGFIAIAPDMLSGKGPGGGGTESLGQDVRRVISELEPTEIARRLQAAAGYATALPAARNAVASIGFCWGGRRSFEFATTWPDLAAAVVYYGTSPGEEALRRVSASVLGLYGGDDARVNADIPRTRETMDRLGKRYHVEVFDGAGHGFLRQQQGRSGANMRATRQAWPRTIAFLQEALEEALGGR